MDGVKYFRDSNGSKTGYNGLAIFINHPETGRDKVGKHKRGWLAIIAQYDGSGDGPNYVADRVSENYIKKYCTEIDETTARREFPRLVKMVEDSTDIWCQ